MHILCMPTTTQRCRKHEQNNSNRVVSWLYSIYSEGYYNERHQLLSSPRIIDSDFRATLRTLDLRYIFLHFSYSHSLIPREKIKIKIRPALLYAGTKEFDSYLQYISSYNLVLNYIISLLFNFNRGGPRFFSYDRMDRIIRYAFCNIIMYILFYRNLYYTPVVGTTRPRPTVNRTYFIEVPWITDW